MGKEKSGSIVKRNGKHYVRIGWTDPTTGKRHELMRRAQDRKHAKQLARDLISKLESAEQEKTPVVGKLTFGQVADRYAEVKLIEAVYVGDRKVAGLRRTRDPWRILTRLKAEFGNGKIASITYNAIDKFRIARLNEGVMIATVNRELALLRSIFNFAKREGWIDRSPFESGEPLIRMSDERRRDRVMSFEEEKKVLEQCVGRRAHMRPIIIIAVDAGPRKGELLTIRKSDVNLGNREIRLRALNTKTLSQRVVPISGRMLEAILPLLKGKEDEDFLFPQGDFKTAFYSICKDAKVKDLRFHDLRHTCATRLISAGMPIEEVMKILGHTQIGTTYRHYLNVTSNTIDRARTAIDAINKGRESEQIAAD